MDEVRCHRCGKRRPYSLLTPGRLVSVALILLVTIAWLAGQTGLEIAGMPAQLLVIVLAVAGLLLVAGVVGLVWVSFALWERASTPQPGNWLPFGVALIGTAPLLLGTWWAIAVVPDDPSLDLATVRIWLWLSVGWLAVGMPLTGLLCWIVSAPNGHTRRGFVVGLAGVLVVALAVVLSIAEAGRWTGAPAAHTSMAAALFALAVGTFAAGYVGLRFLYLRTIYYIVPPTG